MPLEIQKKLKWGKSVDEKSKVAEMLTTHKIFGIEKVTKITS